MHLWFPPLILATQEQKSGGSWFKARLDKQFKRPYLEKQTIIKKGWWSGATCGETPQKSAPE
jgi:hypothetical protein